MSIIDICVCHVEWLQTFPNMILSIVDKFLPEISDHLALLVSLTSAQNGGPKPFRSINAWFGSSTFKPMVKNAWNQLEGWLVHKKLKLKSPIHQWNTSTFGNIDHLEESGG